MAVSILKGDCRDILKTLPDQSVHCCVTSPPYFGLRDYGTAKWDGGDADCDHKPDAEWIKLQINGSSGLKGGFDNQAAAAANRWLNPDGSCRCGATRIDSQIGLEATPDAFVAEMVAVFREVKRVLRDDGTLFLNLGDSYFGGGGHSPNSPSSATSKSGKYGKGGVLIKGHTAAGARRAAAYGNPGKEPASSPENDCLCGNLCGACRAAYRLGKSHRDGPRDSKPAASNSLSIPERRGLQSDHVPTSGLILPVGRSGVATLDPQPLLARADGQHLASLGSMSLECDPRLQQTRSEASNRAGGCLSCGCSLHDCDPTFAYSLACTCDIGSPLDASNQGKSGKSSLDSAYPHLTTTSLKPKDLIGIPWRVAFALQADGWYLRQDIIWSKPNPMPESVTDRCTKAHEYIFLMSKKARYHYDADAIAEPVTASTVERLSQPTLESQAGSSRVPGKTNGNMKAVGRATGDVYTAKAFGTPQSEPRGPKKNFGEFATRNKRSVWEITTQPFSEAHFATFPPDLIEPCIKAGCPEQCCSKCGAPVVRDVERTARVIDRSERTHELGRTRSSGTMVAPPTTITKGWLSTCQCNAPTTGGTVLDPFGGAGTTGLVADRLGRNATLIELNPEYATLAERRIRNDAGLFAQMEVVA